MLLISFPNYSNYSASQCQHTFNVQSFTYFLVVFVCQKIQGHHQLLPGRGKHLAKTDSLVVGVEPAISGLLGQRFRLQ